MSALALPNVGTEEERRGYIGASEMAAILGLDPFKKASEIQLEKLGELPPRPKNERMQRGHRLEDVAAAWYSDETGRRLARINRTVRLPRWPHLACHPDRRVIGESRLVQIKTRWSVPDELPKNWEAQILTELGLTGLAIGDLALMTFEDLVIFEVPRDDLAIRDLFEYAAEWWERHIVRRVPVIDGSPALSRYLNQAPEGPVRRATADEAQYMAQLRRIRDEKRQLELTEGEIENSLRASMAGTSGIEGDGFAIAWKRTKDRVKTDWEALAADLSLSLPPEDYAERKATYTTTQEGTRPFRPTWKGD